MEVEKGTVSVADGSELQQALQNAVNQSSKTDRLLEKVNDLQAQIQETSKGGVHLGPQGSKLETKRYTKLLKIYREALESSERELTLYTQANRAIGRIAETNRDLKGGSTFFLDSNGDPRFKRKAAVIGSLDIPLPRWDGTGQPPPLCGCVPAQPDYVIMSGHQVAACTSSAGPEGPVWILATVIRYDSASAMYEVEDIMEEDAMDDDTGGKIKRHILPRAAVLPLPLYEPPPDCGPFLYHRIGAEVLALFPQTTCFYPGKVVAVPSKKRNAYLVEFVDDEDTDGSIPQRVVSQRYVLALRQ